MADAPISITISLENHDEELAVLGSRDQYLRQIRDALGVKILARHGELRIDGDRDKVERAKSVFEELRTLYKNRQAINSSEVSRILDGGISYGSKPGDTVSTPAPLEIREGSKSLRARTEG